MLFTQSEFTTTIAKLRVFSFLLCLDPEMADELVEITLVRAKVGIDPASLGENLSPHAGDQVILNPPVDLAEGGKVETRPELTASSN
jgi:hypothetical protein